MIYFKRPEPPSELLDEIEWTDSLPTLFLMPTPSSDTSPYPWQNGISADLCEAFNQKYRKRFGGKDRQYIFGTFFSEMLKNSFEHGNNYNTSKYVTVGVWAGSKGILFMFSDQGGFYTLNSTKESLEARQNIPSVHTQPNRGAGTGFGLRHVHSIRVNTKENAIYLTYLLDQE